MYPTAYTQIRLPITPTIRTIAIPRSSRYSPLPPASFPNTNSNDIVRTSWTAPRTDAAYRLHLIPRAMTIIPRIASTANMAASTVSLGARNGSGSPRWIAATAIDVAATPAAPIPTTAPRILSFLTASRTHAIRNGRTISNTTSSIFPLPAVWKLCLWSDSPTIYSLVQVISMFSSV